MSADQGSARSYRSVRSTERKCPTFEVRHQEPGIEPQARAGAPQSQAELDVLDLRRGVASGVEAAGLEEDRATHRAAAGPEGGVVASRPLMGEVMAQVHVLREEAARRWRVVVGAGERRQRRVGGEGRAHAIDHVGVSDAVGVDEEDHLGARRLRAAVARQRRARALIEAQNAHPALARRLGAAVLRAGVDQQNALAAGRRDRGVERTSQRSRRRCRPRSRRRRRRSRWRGGARSRRAQCIPKRAVLGAETSWRSA